MDKDTANGERLSYARCFIEVAASKPLPKSLSLHLEGGEELDIAVEYEWIPPTFGHMQAHYPTKQVWKQSDKEDLTNPIG